MPIKHTFDTIKPHDFDSPEAKKERERPKKRETTIPAGKKQVMGVAVGDTVTYSVTGKIISTRMVDKGKEDEWDQSELRIELDSSALSVDKPSDPKAAMRSEAIDLV